jgi:hypothetical protein
MLNAIIVGNDLPLCFSQQAHPIMFGASDFSVLRMSQPNKIGGKQMTKL